MTLVPANWVALAHELADIAGRIIRPYFRQPIAVDMKPDKTPVSIADRDAEAAIRDRLRAVVPAHGIIGEEHGADNAHAEWVWVIDPIDGTKSFLAGKATFGTLIALLHRGTPVLGIIDQPVAGDRWTGVASQPTRYNGKPARVRACPSLAEATVATTGPSYFDSEGWAAYSRVLAQARTPVWGGDCLNYALLASGFIDLVIEQGLKLHDFAALVPVVTGAGGAMTDWEGQPLTAASTGTVLATGNAALVAPVRHLLTLSN